MESYIISANSFLLAFILPDFSLKSGLPTSPIKRVSPVNKYVFELSFATIVILSGEWPGVSIAFRVILPTLISLLELKDLCGYVAPNFSLLYMVAPV